MCAGPEVTFAEPFVTVQESKTEETFATFSVNRQGPDLNLTTMVSTSSESRVRCFYNM